MKEVTHEDWLKNPTPRMMWVWDNDDDEKEKRIVLYFFPPTKTRYYTVLALNEARLGVVAYKHCAEIEEPKTRRMTNKELSRWLREKPTREYKYKNDNYIYSYHEYNEKYKNENVIDSIMIREDYGEWREPLVEDHSK